MTSKNFQKYSVLIASTLAFTVCFMIWMMFGVIGIPIKKMLSLNATEFGLLTSTPVLTGDCHGFFWVHGPTVLVAVLFCFC